MPLYAYYCTNCHEHSEQRMPVEERDDAICACGGELTRFFVVPHAAPIPGVPNRVNASWRETGQDVGSRLDRHFPR